jgi:hypothetical protein
LRWRLPRESWPSPRATGTAERFDGCRRWSVRRCSSLPHPDFVAPELGGVVWLAPLPAEAGTMHPLVLATSIGLLALAVGLADGHRL